MKLATIYLAMTTAGFVRGREAFIYVRDSTFHSSLFDSGACGIQIIRSEYTQDLLINHLIKGTRLQYRQ
jgi:hypothetical protein